MLLGVMAPWRSPGGAASVFDTSNRMLFDRSSIDPPAAISDTALRHLCMSDAVPM
jgi:hypothetical protein